MHTLYPSTLEAEASWSLNSTDWVPRQPCLHRETLSQKRGGGEGCVEKLLTLLETQRQLTTEVVTPFCFGFIVLPPFAPHTPIFLRYFRHWSVISQRAGIRKVYIYRWTLVLVRVYFVLGNGNWVVGLAKTIKKLGLSCVLSRYKWPVRGILYLQLPFWDPKFWIQNQGDRRE